MKQFYIAGNINLHVIFILFPSFSLFLFGMNGGNNLPVGFTHCIIVKRCEVYVCHLFGTVSQAFAYHGNGYSFFFGGGGPTVTGYIEYKNKTQEKCNYCTIYQCISGFYKKNVELHLLLILAIDSVIYSFYVTILLCKKAPVFD